MDDCGLWDRRVVFFLLALFIWRILYIWAAPIELSPDEAYYWEWSRRLAWGYYSKPPMVAWIMAFSTWLFGNTEFAVRVPAAVLGTLALWCSYRLGRSMFSARTGWWAAVLTAASPGACVAALVMTIDAPLLFFWSLALLCLWKALESEYRSRCGTAGTEPLWWWLAAGAAAGGGFLTKQTMFAFWPVILTFMLLGRDTRPLLKSWRVWMAVAVSFLALTPVIWWNMHHGWITLQHTAHHFEQSDRTLLDSVRTFAEFSGSQLGVISPVTCFLVFVINAACLFQAGRFVFRKDEACRPADSSGTHHVSRAAGILLLTGIAVLLPIALLSLKQRVNANWPAPFYIAPVILVAGWYRGFFKLGPRIDRMKKAVLPGVLIGAAFSMLFYALPFVMPVSGLEGSAVDVTARVRGWKELALRVDSIRKTLPHPERTFLVTRRRQTAAELAFYVSGNPRPYRWSGNRMRVTTQYELWPGPGSREEGMDALVVIDVDKSVPSDLPQHFDDFRMLRQVEIFLGNGKARRYMIYFGESFKPTVL